MPPGRVFTRRLWRVICLQPPSGCWLDPVLCCRTKTSVSLLLSAAGLSFLLRDTHLFSPSFQVTTSSNRGSSPSQALNHSGFSFWHNPPPPPGNISVFKDLRNYIGATWIIQVTSLLKTCNLNSISTVPFAIENSILIGSRN